ncbi:unnamed protein product, partial [Phaeothamnion confervicola]
LGGGLRERRLHHRQTFPLHCGEVYPAERMRSAFSVSSKESEGFTQKLLRRTVFGSSSRADSLADLVPDEVLKEADTSLARIPSLIVRLKNSLASGSPHDLAAAVSAVVQRLVDDEGEPLEALGGRPRPAIVAAATANAGADDAPAGVRGGRGRGDDDS